MAHALLSPSSASRWLECPPSARLEADRPDKAGEAADEGTLAHKLSEAMLEYELKRISKAAFNAKVEAVEKNKHYNDAMWEYCDQFKTFVMQQYNEAQTRSKDALIFLEESINLTQWIPEGFGTRDVAIVANHTLDITDLKYGKGVQVDATNNRQMMLYALGTLEEYDVLFDIKMVRMTIYQPRIDNYSTWEISAEDLRLWADEVLVPVAKLAWEGKGDFNPGKHCQFCRVKNTCKANADYQMTIAIHDFEEPKELSDEDLVDVFQRAAMFKNWINSVEEYMLQASVNDGKKWPGLKLVTGKSSRVISDKEKVIKLLAKKEVSGNLYLSKPTLLGIGALEKNFGKAALSKMIGKFIIKPEGKPALVNAEDPRTEYNSLDKAIEDFG